MKYSNQTVELLQIVKMKYLSNTKIILKNKKKLEFDLFKIQNDRRDVTDFDKFKTRKVSQVSDFTV